MVLARDPRKINNLSFFGLSFSMGGWTLGISGFLLSYSYNTAFIWSKLYYLFPLLIALFLMIFSFSFPSNKINKYFLLGIFVIFISLAVPLELVHSFLTISIIYYSWGKKVTLNMIDYIFYSFYIIAYFSISLLFIFYKTRRLKGLYSKQSFFFFIGFLIASLLGVTFNLILPGLGNYKLIWLGPLFTGLVVISVAYSIVKHKMFDIKLVIARSMSYIIAILLLAFFYGFVVFSISKFIFKTNIDLRTQIFLSVATGFVGLTFSKIKKIFDKISNSFFYRDAYDPQILFDRLNKILVSTIDINKMLRDTTKILMDNFKSSYVAVGLRTDDDLKYRIIGTEKLNFDHAEIDLTRKLTPYIHKIVIVTDLLSTEDEVLKNILSKNNIAVIVRLTNNTHTNSEGLGYIIFGPKKSGNQYNNQDFRVLDTVSKELIIAIQNALHFEEIENFNITLQAKIDEATKKLRRSNEKLKALDESKDDFISMASHQLRTPLTSVKGYISMVMEGDFGKINKMQATMLRQAFFSSQRMVYLIADLLNISRLKTGKFIIEANSVDLSKTISEELDQLKEVSLSKKIILEYHEPKSFPKISLDETKTRQVIMNFIDNAIYYTPAGGHIDLILEDKPHSIEFKVIDNGIGVPKSEQHHLFTKFYRAVNARKMRPDGTGLGLYMAKKVIIAEGGSVIFESQEGKGSTFGFIFPKKN